MKVEKELNSSFPIFNFQGQTPLINSETGRIVEVLYNPDNGERRYAAVSSPSAPPERQGDL